MSANHVTFTGAIHQAAADLGRAPTPEQVERLNLELQTLAVIDDETGTVSVPVDAGAPLAIDKFLTGAVAKFPAIAASPAASAPTGWVQVKIGSGTGYRRADDPMLSIMKAIGESHNAALLEAIPTWPNPWSPAHLNRTRQTIITNKNPALAAQLKAKAA